MAPVCSSSIRPCSHCPSQVADPLGGSFYIEALTSAMEEQAERVIQEVEHLGGMTEAIISGMWRT